MTSDTIVTLRAEAEAVGDVGLVAVCDRALAGDREAIEACLRVLDPGMAAED